MLSNNNMEMNRRKKAIELLNSKRQFISNIEYEKILNTISSTQRMKKAQTLDNAMNVLNLIDRNVNTYEKAIQLKKRIKKQLREQLQESPDVIQEPKSKQSPNALYFEITMYHRLDRSIYNTRETTHVIKNHGDRFEKKQFGQFEDITVEHHNTMYKAFSNCTVYFSGNNKYHNQLKSFGSYIDITRERSAHKIFDFLKMFNPTEYEEFYTKYRSLIESEYDVDLLEISNISIKKINTATTNFNKVMAMNDARSACYSFKYIAYTPNDGYIDLVNNIYETDYVKNNLVPQSCWFSVVLDAYRDGFKKSKREYGFDIDYKWLFDLVYPKKPLSKKDTRAFPDKKFNENGENPCCFDDMVDGFFKKYRLGIYMFDISYRIIAHYEPENRNKNLNPNCLYILYHDNHIYRINHELKSLQHILQNFFKTTIIENPTNTYYMPKIKGGDKAIYRVENKDDLVAIINNNTIIGDIDVIFENDSIFNLWSQFYCDDNIKFECKLFMNNQDVTGFQMLNINGKSINVTNIRLEGVINEMNFGNVEVYKQFNKAKDEIFSKFININYKSSYSEQVRKMLYSNIKGGIKGAFGSIFDEPFEGECYNIDFKKCYTSVFMDMYYLPVVNSFDNFLPYSGGELEAYTLYYVEKLNDELVYPMKRFDLCYGINLRDVAGIRIISELRPSKLIINPAREFVQKLYENQNITIQMKKDIMNSLIGMFDKRFNKKHYVSTTMNEEECNSFQELYHGRKILKTLPNGEKIFFLYKEVKEELIDGFKLISYFIKDTTDKMILGLKEKLEMFDMNVLGIETDACFVEIDDEKLDAFKKVYPQYFQYNSELQGIGKLRVAKKDFNMSARLSIMENDCTFYEVGINDVNVVPLLNEWDMNELSNIYENHNLVLCKAECAGAVHLSTMGAKRKC